VLWRAPANDDDLAPSNYKSFARVSLVTGTDSGKTYFYLLGMFWGKNLLKETLVRIQYDAADPYGLGGDPEVVRYVPQNIYTWEACPHGRLPDWLDTQTGYSIVNGFFNAFTSSVFATTRIPGYRYVALGVANSTPYFGVGGPSNSILYSLSNDLIHWTGQRYLRSNVAHLADGFGYAASVIDPIAVEDPGGGLHLYVTSNDDNGDGVADCLSDPSFGPTAVYVGAGIYEAPLAWEELTPTSVTMTPPAPTVTRGTWHFAITVKAADGTLPAGFVSGAVFNDTPLFDGYPQSFDVKVTDGKADVSVVLATTGSYHLTLNFTSLGPWNQSSTSVSQVVVPPTHHRAAGH
jgi:hypothetical protein